MLSSQSPALIPIPRAALRLLSKTCSTPLTAFWMGDKSKYKLQRVAILIPTRKSVPKTLRFMFGVVSFEL